MKTLNRTNSQPQGLALLQANPGIEQARIAVLDAALSVTDDGWQQLLPAGDFSARDGRPFDVPDHQWHLDGNVAAILIAKAKLLGQDILIDYDHQTLRTEQNGQPAPAAGWFNGDEIEWRDGVGLFVKPRWTAMASQMIANGEYRFMSAVFPYDENGIPLEIRMAAITNDPGVVGMQALAALSAQLITEPSQTTSTQEQNPMNDLLIQLLAKLGITAPTDGQMTNEQCTACMAALDAVLGASAKNKELEQQIATLKAAAPPPGQVDLSQYVPVATYDALVQQVATLSAQVETTDAESLLKEAKQSGKVLVAEEDYLRQFAQQKGVAALKAMLDKRPAIAALTALQTAQITKPDPQSQSQAVLTAEDKYAANQLGISHADFAKAKETK